MKNSIDDAFANRGTKPLLMPFVEAGLPTNDITERTVLAMEEVGAQLIELGIPFSDPVADGPTIQRASEIALEGGTTLKNSLASVATIRQNSSIPIVLFSYYNPIYAMGIDSFVAKAHKAGVDAVLVPDMPLEESFELQKKLAAKRMHFIYLIAQTSTDERIKKIVARASGFLYLVAVLGVTGAREKLDPNLKKFTKRVRAFTDLPLAVGFGLSKKEHIAEVGTFADGAIIASAIADRVMSCRKGSEVKVAKAFVKEIAP